MNAQQGKRPANRWRGRVAYATAALLCPLFAPGLTTAADAAPRATQTRAAPTVTTENETAGYRVRQPQSFAAFTPPSLGPLDVSRFAFTAPSGPARTSRAPTTVERSFSFTPSGSSERSSNRVQVTSTTRVAASAPVALRPQMPEPVASGMQASGYAFDLSVGYQDFAVSGGVARFDTGVSRKEAADIGLSYAARNWKTGVKASLERGNMLPIGDGLDTTQVGVEASGALALTPGISVGTTLRYRLAPHNPTPLDPNKDERTLLVGGALAF